MKKIKEYEKFYSIVYDKTSKRYLHPTGMGNEMDTLAILLDTEEFRTKDTVYCAMCLSQKDATIAQYAIAVCSTWTTTVHG